MGEKHPVHGKSMSTNFPGSPHRMGFFAFFRAMGNRWGNSCMFHVMKYTIRWSLDGEKAPLLWEKHYYQFRRFSSYLGICCVMENMENMENLFENSCIPI